MLTNGKEKPEMGIKSIQSTEPHKAKQKNIKERKETNTEKKYNKTNTQFTVHTKRASLNSLCIQGIEESWTRLREIMIEKREKYKIKGKKTMPLKRYI